MMVERPLNRLLLPLAGLLLLAFALRLFRLDFQSIWWDEGISLHLATSGLGDIIRDRLDNIHPPLYFFILKGWLALVGVSPFTGRYLSALASLGQVALVFAAVRSWGGRRNLLPWIAAVLILLSPLSVIYGQEIRVYAMLPLAYLTMLLLAERLLTGDKVDNRTLLFLVVAEWIGLHLHYIALFAVAYIALWGVAALARRRDKTALRRWLVAQTIVALASLPWFLMVVSNWTAIQAEANAGTFTTEPVPLSFLFAQVWAFQLTGLAGSLSSRFVQIGAALAVGLAVSLFAARMAAGGRQRPVTLRVAAHWLVPLISALVVWSVRSFSHPRYIIMFAAMFIPLAAFLLYPARRRLERVAALLLAACLIALSVWGLGRYFFHPGAAKPDMRGVARFLESTAGRDDLILVPDTDWSLPFEYDGPADVVMPHLGESNNNAESVLNRVLGCAGSPCAPSRRVFVVDYPRGTRDWQGRLPFELERRGYWLNETNFDDLAVREYRLLEPDEPLPTCDAPELIRPAARFGPLLLESAWMQQGAAADTAIAVALCWRLLDPTAETFVGSLILRDPLTGERIAQGDTTLIDPDGAPTTHWSPGATVMTYHLLPLPPGTPPVDLDLALGVYSGSEDNIRPVEAADVQGNALGELLPLGDIGLSSPIGLSSTPYDVESPPLWEESHESAGLRLLGARFSPGPYRPGQTIRVGLTWQSAADALPDIRPTLILEQGNVALVENADAPANGRYPTDRWSRDEIVFENRDIRVPAEAEGDALLSLMIDGVRIELGKVAIEGATINFERPPVTVPVDVIFGEDIALIGFDPPPSVDPSRPVPLTLYWQSLSDNIETGYTVFVHLLAEDGRIIAQHDSPPANGGRPTDEWLMEEYVIDPHELTWREPDYSGPARLSVGLYEPVSGERPATADGFDHFILPVMITVEPAG
jgi:hypothetical protein